MNSVNMDELRHCVIETQSGNRIPLTIDTITTNRYEYPEIKGHLFNTALIRKKENQSRVSIKNVVFNEPATIVMWSDGSKTVVKCQPGDIYSKETGLAMCISKKFLGNKGNFNEVFKKWIPEETVPEEFDDFEWHVKPPYPVGTKILILNAGEGAYGANGKTGVITVRRSSAGLLTGDRGYNVNCNGQIWRISPDAEIIKE